MYNNRHANLLTLLINEIYAQYEYAGKLKPNLYHYQTHGGSSINLVLKTNEKLVSIECITTVDINTYKQRGLKNFIKKYSEAEGYFVAPIQEPYKIEHWLFVIPWNFLA